MVTTSCSPVPRVAVRFGWRVCWGNSRYAWGSLCSMRAPRLLKELPVADGDGSFGKRLAQLARLDLLILGSC